MSPIPRRLAVLLSCVTVVLSGCNWFTGLAFILPEQQRTIPAEYAHLRGRVAALVWVAPETLYDYPHVRLEIAGHVMDQIARNVTGVEVVDVLAVEDFVESQRMYAADPEQVGRQFDCDYVIYMELLHFSMRYPGAPDLVQGHLRASVSVVDLSKADAPPERFELAPVEVHVPEGQPIAYSRVRLLTARKQTYETFAGTVAKKFHEHQEVVR